MQTFLVLLNKKDSIWGRAICLIPLLIFLCCSCTPIIKTLYGVQQPKFESNKNMVRFVQKLGLDTNNIIAIKDTSSMFRLFRHNKKLPSIKIFDNKGRLLSKTVEKGCDAGVHYFVSRYDTLSEANKDRLAARYNENIQEISNSFAYLDGKPAHIDASASDLSVVFYYAHFLADLVKNI